MPEKYIPEAPPYFRVMSPEQRFWHFTDKNGPMPAPYTGLTTRCWQWTGNLANDGYGMIRAYGKKLLAHRFAYELLVGILGQLQALHHCDNAGCVNPEHLFKGSQEDNIHDMCIKSRQRTGSGNTPLTAARGEACGSAKLTEETVRSIRAMYVSGVVGYIRVARSFNVTPRTVRLIVLNETWKHVS